MAVGLPAYKRTTRRSQPSLPVKQIAGDPHLVFHDQGLHEAHGHHPLPEGSVTHVQKTVGKPCAGKPPRTELKGVMGETVRAGEATAPLSLPMSRTAFPVGLVAPVFFAPGVAGRASGRQSGPHRLAGEGPRRVFHPRAEAATPWWAKLISSEPSGSTRDGLARWSMARRARRGRYGDRLAGADEEKAAPTDDEVGDEDWRPRMSQETRRTAAGKKRDRKIGPA